MLSQDKTGLIIVDVQGKLARLVYESETLISNCSKLIAGAKALGLPIVVLEQNPDKLGKTVEELSAHLGDINPITKFTFNACDSSDFVSAIKEMDVDTWLICGIEAHICVYQTAKGLIELGFNVELVNDCVSSRTRSNAQLGINRMQERGVGISGLEMCLYELVKDCRSAEFKEVLHLVR